MMRITIVYAQGMSSAPSSLCFPCSYTLSFFFSLYFPFYYHSMHIRTIPIRGDKILLLTTKDQSKWCFPKGGWETDETLEEAARRETREEAGVCFLLLALCRLRHERSRSLLTDSSWFLDSHSFSRRSMAKSSPP